MALGVDNYLKFNGYVTESTLVVTNRPIHSIDVRKFLRAYMIDFPHRTRIVIYCGTHGASDGSIGETSDFDMGDMINQYKQVVADLLTKDTKRMKLIKEKNIRFEIRFVGKLPGFDTHLVNCHELKGTMDNMMGSEDPYVVILAFCYTRKSILRAMMMEMGYLAILSSKAERSLLSGGTCHKVAECQQTPLKKVRLDQTLTKDNLKTAESKNMFLYGSTGTGKTEILKHVVRMRTEFYKRIYKEDPCMINVIIAVYRKDAVQLMEQFKEDFADLVEDPKIKEEFKSFGIRLDCIKKKA